MSMRDELKASWRGVWKCQNCNCQWEILTASGQCGHCQGKLIPYERRAILSKPEELPTREQLLKQIAVHMDTIRTQSDQLSKPEEPRGDGLAESTREDWWPCPSCGQKMRPDLGYLSETLGMTCTECGNRIIITRKAWIAFPPTAITSPARTEELREAARLAQQALIVAIHDPGYDGPRLIRPAIEALKAALSAHPPQQGEV
jgi:DNA-directed RNA polymerase subunit RPC12/RpoP